MNNYTAIIEARMGSSRLPGKVVLNVNNIPMIILLIDRLKQVRDINKIIVATTENINNDNFCYLLNLSNVVVTGDTIALHIAISLEKNIISFFGPTPHQEVDLFGLGKKFVRKELDCLNCYEQFTFPYDV